MCGHAYGHVTCVYADMCVDRRIYLLAVVRMDDRCERRHAHTRIDIRTGISIEYRHVSRHESHAGSRMQRHVYRHRADVAYEMCFLKVVMAYDIVMAYIDVAYEKCFRQVV